MNISPARLQQARTHWPIIVSGVVLGFSLAIAGGYSISTYFASHRDRAYVASQERIREAIHAANPKKVQPTPSTLPGAIPPSVAKSQLIYNPTGLKEDDEVVVELCFYCDAFVVENWYVYDSRDVDGHLNVRAFNLTNQEDIELVSYDTWHAALEQNITDEKFTPSLIRINQVGEYWYLYIQGEIAPTPSALYTLNSTTNTISAELLLTSNQYLYVDEAYGYNWITDGYGHSCGAEHTWYRFNQETNERFKVIEAVYGCRDGYEILGKYSDAELLVLNREYDKDQYYSGFDKVSSLEAVSLEAPYDRRILVNSDQLPDEPLKTTYVEDLQTVVFANRSGNQISEAQLDKDGGLILNTRTYEEDPIILLFDKTTESLLPLKSMPVSTVTPTPQPRQPSIQEQLPKGYFLIY